MDFNDKRTNMASGKPGLKGIALFALLLFLSPSLLFSQIQEPPLEPPEDASSAYEEGYRYGFGMDVLINNFGFGVGGAFVRTFRPDVDAYLNFSLTGLRDVSEQTYTDYFFGQQTIPNKYQRALAFPVTVGVRHRLFSEEVSDDYRFYIGGGLGPTVAFSYPYFDDFNNNGYREQFNNYYEQTFDLFRGFGDGEFHLGLNGELKLNLDLGQNFARLMSLQFGYTFHYFPSGIQIMQPNQPLPKQNPEPGDFPYETYPDGHERAGEVVTQPFFEPQKFFGTPQINLIFGRMHR